MGNVQGGVSIGAGAGAGSALHAVLSRVVCARGAAGAHAALRMVCAVWRRDAADAGAAYDLQATLLRVAHPMLQVLSGRYTHHAVSLFDTVGEYLTSFIFNIRYVSYFLYMYTIFYVNIVLSLQCY